MSDTASNLADDAHSPKAGEDVADLLRALLAEVRGLRSDIRYSTRGDRVPRLIEALSEYFGSGRFTARGLLMLAGDEPHSKIANALATLVDLNQPSRSLSTALGIQLRKLPDIEIVADQRGSAVYCLRTSPE